MIHAVPSDTCGAKLDTGKPADTNRERAWCADGGGAAQQAAAADGRSICHAAQSCRSCLTVLLCLFLPYCQDVDLHLPQSPV